MYPFRNDLIAGAIRVNLVTLQLGIIDNSAKYVSYVNSSALSRQLLKLRSVAVHKREQPVHPNEHHESTGVLAALDHTLDIFKCLFHGKALKEIVAAEKNDHNARVICQNVPLETPHGIHCSFARRS